MWRSQKLLSGRNIYDVSREPKLKSGCVTTCESAVTSSKLEVIFIIYLPSKYQKAQLSLTNSSDP